MWGSPAPWQVRCYIAKKAGHKPYEDQRAGARGNEFRDEAVAVLGLVRQRRERALGLRHIPEHRAVYLPREAKALGGKLRRGTEALPQRAYALLPLLALPLGVGL